LICSLLLFFYAYYPFYFYNSDLAVFGLMARDLVTLHYFPLLMYGQDYLFTPVPLLGAAFTLLGLKTVLAMRLAAATVSLAGLWLLFETLLATTDESSYGRLTSTVIFPLLFLSNAHIALSFNRFDGTAVYYFALGAGLYLVTRLRGGEGKGTLWFLMGVLLGFTYISRPPALIIIGAAFLWVHRRNLNLKRSFLTGLGVVVGFLPLLLHILFRADFWPISHFRPSLQIGNIQEIGYQSEILFTKILPYLFGLTDFPALHAWVNLLFCIVVVALLLKPQKPLTTGLLFGTAFLFCFLIFVKDLTQNLNSSRYCLGLVLVAQLVACYSVHHSKRATLSLLTLSILMLAASGSGWNEELRLARESKTDWERMRSEIVPQLSSYELLVCDYWDGYSLDLFLEDKIAVEIFPFQSVRLQGRHRELLLQGKGVWMVRDSERDGLWKRLRDNGWNPGTMNRVSSFRWQGRSYSLYSDPGNFARRLMERENPSYFLFHHPPGRNFDTQAFQRLGLETLKLGKEAKRSASGSEIVSRPSTSEPRIIAYGPYVPLPQGSFRVECVLEISDVREAGTSRVEVVCGPNFEVLAEESIQIKKGEPSRNSVTLSFDIPDPLAGLPMECRFWSEGLFTVSIEGIEYRKLRE